MSSPGTAADITPLEASDLLNKWMTESIKVHGLLATANGFQAAVLGTLLPFPDGAVRVVLDRDPPLTTFFEFKPASAVRFTYGYTRAFPEEKLAEISGGLRLSSALSFIFSDGSLVVLFEVAD